MCGLGAVIAEPQREDGNWQKCLMHCGKMAFIPSDDQKISLSNLSSLEAFYVS